MGAQGIPGVGETLRLHPGCGRLAFPKTIEGTAAPSLIIIAPDAERMWADG
jgi:hypothetical protein